MEPIDISFPSSNINPDGQLQVPESYNQGERLPGIDVLHPGGGIKEQTAGIYASQLSMQGFITLAFDRRSQGTSEGTPRHLEDPFAGAEDTKSAVTYLTTLDKVNPKRIGVLGICAGSIAKETHDALIVQPGENGTKVARGGEVKYLPYIPPDMIHEDNVKALMKEAADLLLDLSRIP
ncbi:hypothetical protein BGX24_010603 [Mortierella sp. AD032]|nr:hypothetical protein BGX24_010603 [Mortierella sp. AD032]